MYGYSDSIGCLDVSVQLIGGGLTVTATMVCTTAVDEGYDTFMAKDGEFVLADGLIFKTIRDE